MYSVKATNVAQIQLAVNFARNTNIRLVVHNTGHDYLVSGQFVELASPRPPRLIQFSGKGRSTGAGSLSIWTHNLKGIDFIENYQSAGNYTGPAFRLGAGVQVYELYEAADAAGYTAVGGECRVSFRMLLD